MENTGIASVDLYDVYKNSFIVSEFFIVEDILILIFFTFE